MFVVTRDHDSFYRGELADVDRKHVLEQPANRGTGVAIIAARFNYWSLKSTRIVGIFPSDLYYFADNAAFAAMVKSAIDISNEHSDSVILIGAKPEWPEVEFGWIEPEFR